MGFQDREYYRHEQSYGGGGRMGGMRIGLPRPTNMVKLLLIINIVVFVLQLIFRRSATGMELPFMEKWFSAMGSRPFEVWRLITFQFLHHDTWHIMLNMLGLYFLGPTLERSWGSKSFLKFYLVCGAVGGLLFVVANALGIISGGLLYGASGGVLGMLVACAILFPHFVVLLFIFPVPIRFAAGLFTVVYILSVISGEGNAGGDLCHLGGMAMGLIWVLGGPYFASMRQKSSAGTYQRKMEQDRAMQYEIDQILAKVHKKGIQSLTRKEKQILQRATDQKRQSK